MSLMLLVVKKRRRRVQVEKVKCHKGVGERYSHTGELELWPSDFETLCLSVCVSLEQRCLQAPELLLVGWLAGKAG